MTETVKKSWFKRDVSPGFQRFLNVLFYGLGRGAASFSHHKNLFVEKHKALNDEIREHNKKNPEKKRHQKRFGIMNGFWFWLKGFSEGVNSRQKQYKALRCTSLDNHNVKKGKCLWCKKNSTNFASVPLQVQDVKP